MIPIAGRSRGGFGTTTTFVLVTTGIALMILIFANLQASGTRISIERAYTTGHLLRVGKMALHEAFTSKRGQDAFTQAMLKGLVEAAAAVPSLPRQANTPDEKDQYLHAFIDTILVKSRNDATVPADRAELVAALPPVQGDLFPLVIDPLAPRPPGQNPTPVPGVSWWGDNGNVVFGSDDRFAAEYKPDILDAAYQDEIKAGVLKVEPVQMRVVAFRASQTQGAGLPAGKGIVRGRVKVRWVLPREYEGKAMSIGRVLMEDRVFRLTPPPPIFDGSGNRLPQTQDWDFEMLSEWQREALDE